MMMRHLFTKTSVAIFILLSSAAYGQGIITSIAGNGVTQYIGDGSPAISFSLAEPTGICKDKRGNLLISDRLNKRVRQLINDTLSTICGNGTSAYTGDGGPATAARTGLLNGICIDTSDNVYISDGYYQVIRKINRNTGIISTFGGNGSAGFSGDGSLATSAELSAPAGVCTDVSGNVYVADMDNQRIRKINALTGIITTVAGNGTNGYTGDGGVATSATLSYPNAVCTDSAGNLYISDRGNSCIRKVDATTGIISTIAGTGVQGYTGDGGPASAAKLRSPSGVWAMHGVIYIADKGNNVVRAITTGGIIYTIVGNGVYGYLGDGGLAINARLADPISMWVDTDNTIYVCDLYNSVIRKVTAPVLGINESVTPGNLSVYPTPTTGHVFINTSLLTEKQITICNTMGQTVYTTQTNEPSVTVDLSLVPAGMYYITCKSSNTILYAKIVKL